MACPEGSGHLKDWTAGGPVIPYDPEIARVWGQLAGAAQLRGRPRPQNDTWIAACCLRYQVPLVTLNTADFADFAEQHGLALLDQHYRPRSQHRMLTAESYYRAAPET